MVTIFLRHSVRDYDAWRPHYDEDRPRRDSAGLTELGVYRDAGDPNVVLLVWSADDTGGFEAMMASEALREKMQSAGVEGAPEVWIAR